MLSVKRICKYLAALLGIIVLLLTRPFPVLGSDSLTYGSASQTAAEELKATAVLVPNGTYHIHSALNTNQILDVTGAGTANRTLLQLYGKKLEMQGSENQKFEVTRLSSGWYTIKDVNSGRLLDVRGGSKESGTPVQIYSSNNTKAQHWKFYTTGESGTYFIKNELGCWLDAKGGACKNGTPVQVYSYNGTTAQKWQLSPALKKSSEVKVSASTKTFKSGLDNSKVIDVSGAGTANGTKIQLWNSNGSECQKFDLIRLSSGWYEIVDANSGKALDVENGVAGNSVKVQLWARDNTKAQHWKFYNAGSGYYYVMNELGYFLDARGGESSNGTQIQVYQFNGTKAQKWLLADAAKKKSAPSANTADRICSAINNDTSLGLTASKKKTLVIMARTLLNAGYEPTFSAGVLANIKYEGAVGVFESSNYRIGEPKYLVYMDKNFNYRKKYSGKNVTDVSLSELNTMLVTLKSRGWPGKFGLGCVQWTGGRTYNLVQVYRTCAGGRDRITFNEAAEAECKMIIQELRGSYKSVYTNWKSANSGKTAEKAAYDAASRFCLYYEVPSNKSTKAVQRGNFAKKLYAVMMK